MITDLGFLGLGAKHIALDLVSPVVFLSEILGSEKVRLFATCDLLTTAFHASLCLLCLSDVRCVSGAAIAPRQMIFFVIKNRNGSTRPSKTVYFVSTCFFQKFVSML